MTRRRSTPLVFSTLEPRRSGSPAYAQIEEQLAAAIAAGSFAPGEQLPGEVRLAGQLGVSRMTLRHALDRLERRGLITRTVGRRGGTFVTKPKLDLDLRAFAGFSEQLRRQGITAGAQVVSAVEQPAGTDVATALEIDEENPVYKLVRIRSAGGEPIALEHSYFPAVRYPGFLDQTLRESIYDLLEEHYDDHPTKALERIEALAAGPEEAEALCIAEGSPVMLLERIAFSDRDVPLEFARDFFRGDRSRVVIWLPEYPLTPASR